MLPAVALSVPSAPDTSQRPVPPPSSAEAAFLLVLAELTELSAAPVQEPPGGHVGVERPEPPEVEQAESISHDALPPSAESAVDALPPILSAPVFAPLRSAPLTATISAEATGWVAPMQSGPMQSGPMQAAPMQSAPMQAVADPARSAEAAPTPAIADDAAPQTPQDLPLRPNGHDPARPNGAPPAAAFPNDAPSDLPEPETRSPVTWAPHPGPGGGLDTRSALPDDALPSQPDDPDRAATARAAPDPTVPQPDQRPSPPAASPLAGTDPFPQPKTDAPPTIQGDAAIPPSSNAPLPAQTAPPAPPSANPFAAQLAEDLHAVSARAEDGTITLQLRPEELGKLQFHLSRTAEGLHIHLIVDQPATLDLLRKHADDLLGDLRQGGFAGTTLSFAGSGAGDGSPDNPAPPARPRPEAGDRTACFAPLPPPAPLNGALDLRL